MLVADDEDEITNCEICGAALERNVYYGLTFPGEPDKVLPVCKECWYKIYEEKE